MNSILRDINPKKEELKITTFIRNTLQKTGFKKLIIGISGGIDSTTSLYLVRKVLPPKNIFIAHLYYFQSHEKHIKKICSYLQIPSENQYLLSIKPMVEAFMKIDDGELKVEIEDRKWKMEKNQSSHIHPQNPSSTLYPLSSRIRLGNIMARVRMIILFDLAKKHKALVCGTENKSEHYLGYFTRFGDAASDIEPIQHLYKTQVYELAKYLKVPKEVLEAKPSAGLWSNQTDEGEFGFSYKEADQVLFLYFEKKLSVREIKNRGFKNARKILDFVKQNSFKHHTPYSL